MKTLFPPGGRFLAIAGPVLYVIYLWRSPATSQLVNFGFFALSFGSMSYCFSGIRDNLKAECGDDDAVREEFALLVLDILPWAALGIILTPIIYLYFGLN